MHGIGRFAKRFGPLIIMTLFTIIDGVGAIQAEDEIEEMKEQIKLLEEKVK